jgi:hypothetical protein
MFRERPRTLRLEIDQEARALVLSIGATAYSIACQRAEEASSYGLANDWIGVATAIGRLSRKQPSWLAYVLR